MKKIFLCLICLICLCGCEKKEIKNPIVTMEIEDYGTVKFELYPEYAPNTVANFVNLVEEGFYDGNSFHRLVPGFILQGGDPNGNGSGGPGYAIKGEFAANGYKKNTLSHTEGIISMARQNNNMDSQGSQFFFVLSDDATSSLDDLYASFGKVLDDESMEVLHKIENKAKVANNVTGKLEKNITITKVTVDTFGETYKVKKISN